MDQPARERGRRPGRPVNPISRERLLSIAREVFAERGYAGTSMAEIAGRAGMRKGSLFHHFTGKEALYLEVMSSVVDHLHRQVQEMELLECDFHSRLDRLGEMVVGFLAERRSAARLLMREMIDRGPYLRGPGGAAMKATMEATASFLAAGTAGGGEVDDHARHLALSTVGMLLFPFAIPDLAGGVLGQDLFSPEAVKQRRDAVMDHVRALCHAQPDEGNEE